ncbi:MAG: hypothetical protein KDB22_22980, partial [Planctomycetales bacterium]|nr:hypothetical protein [Planctomycetales bacterium]
PHSNVGQRNSQHLRFASEIAACRNSPPGNSSEFFLGAESLLVSRPELELTHSFVQEENCL